MADWTSLMEALNRSVVSRFGREVQYLPAGGEAVTVQAVFEETREQEGQSPAVYRVVFLRVADLPAAPQTGDSLLADNVAYRVFEVALDAEGGAHLALHA